jgi:hypothetical protein
MARDGFVITAAAVPEATCDAVLAELAPHLARTAYMADDGLGKTTRRTGSVVARAPSSWDLIAHPRPRDCRP